MKYLDELKRIGLKNNEAKVYLTLLKLGSTKAGKISKNAELDRSSTYNALKSLLKKGLVSYITLKKVKYFQVSNPENIKIYLKDKLETINNILPDLKKQYKTQKLEENVRLFKGRKGVKYVLDDILKEGKENLVFGSEGQLKQNYPLYAKQFAFRIKKREILIKSIVRENRVKKDTDFTKYKYISSKSESPVVTNIYGNKIAIIIWSEPPEIILIENKKAADSYREYFEFMWKNAKKK